MHQERLPAPRGLICESATRRTWVQCASRWLVRAWPERSKPLDARVLRMGNLVQTKAFPRGRPRVRWHMSGSRFATLAGAWMLGLATLAGCAVVPRESVELSATVGRDIAEIERSHRALVRIYYDQMEAAVNRFVDEVYAPYQIGETLKDPGVGGALSVAIEEAGSLGATDNAKQVAFDAIGYYLLGTRENVEGFRRELLQPLLAQRDTLLLRLDEAYQRVQEGNSTVTGYLASVVKVTDEQNRVLAQIGLPDLQSEMTGRADSLSRGLEAATTRAREGKEGLDQAIEDGRRLLNEFKDLRKK